MRNRLVFAMAAGLAGLSSLACAGGSDAGSEAGDPLASITAEEMASHVRTLASDGFRGRSPGGDGERLTLDYLIGEFEALGLEPGHGDSWTQEVPLVSIEARPGATLTVTGGEEPLAFSYGSEAMVWTRQLEETIGLDDSELVFVGYGIRAPEYDWNDYAGVDVEGKTVVLLVNDPGYATGDPELFDGNAMTYYGRWTYKYAEAARQGADGAIIVHETGPAGYGWEVVSGSWSGPQFHLPGGEEGDLARVEGWITHESAVELFRAAGMDLAELEEAAAGRGFQARPMGLTASVELSNTIERSSTHNVLARLPGTERPDETVVYTAHWDHLGVDPTREGDSIFNGARDNASGTAALLEIAEAFTRTEPAPERSILFLPVGAEEQGLLGSAYYAENPVYPLETTVAAINIDGMNVWGPTEDIAVVGMGQSELDDYLSEAAAGQGRTVRPEAHPEKGYYYRSDHFNFARKGVPSLYTDVGTRHREEGPDYMERMMEEYRAERYHQPSDEYDADWDLRGAVEDARLLYRVGHRLSMETAFPRWSEGSEFRAVRRESEAARQDDD